MQWNVRLAVAICTTMVGVVVLALVVWWSATQPPPFEPPTVTVPARTTYGTVPTRGVHVRGGESLEARARISELEQRLRQQERLVAAKNRDLRDIQLKMQALRTELADTSEWARLANLGLLDAPAPVEPPPAESTDAGPELDVSPLASVVDPGLDDTIREANLELALEQANQRATMLESELADRRAAQLEAFQRIGPAGVDGLIEALESQRRSVRLWACDGLADLGPDAVEAQDALRVLLRDEDAEVRVRATVALQRVRE